MMNIGVEVVKANRRIRLVAAFVFAFALIAGIRFEFPRAWADATDIFNRNAILTGYLSEQCAGTGTLSGGTLAVTLSANCSAGTPLYVCTDQTAAAACKTGVSSTTLTLTGTSTDVIAYARVQ